MTWDFLATGMTYKTVENAILGILDKNTCREVGYAYRCYPLGLERHFSVLFSENHVDRPIFNRIIVTNLRFMVQKTIISKDVNEDIFG